MDAEAVGFHALEGSAHGGVRRRGERRSTRRQVGPLVRQKPQEHEAVAALFDVYADVKVGGNDAGGFVVVPGRLGRSRNHVGVLFERVGCRRHVGRGERQKGQRPVVLAIQGAGVSAAGLDPRAARGGIDGKVSAIAGVLDDEDLVGHRDVALVDGDPRHVRGAFGEVQQGHSDAGGRGKVLAARGPVHGHGPVAKVRDLGA